MTTKDLKKYKKEQLADMVVELQRTVFETELGWAKAEEKLVVAREEYKKLLREKRDAETGVLQPVLKLYKEPVQQPRGRKILGRVEVPIPFLDIKLEKIYLWDNGKRGLSLSTGGMALSKSKLSDQVCCRILEGIQPTGSQ